MQFTDVANDLLEIADRRNKAFGDEVSALGEDTWHVLLKLFVYRHSEMIVRRTTLEGVMKFPKNLDRILTVLSNRDLVTEESGETCDDQSIKITETAVRKIQVTLNGAFGVTKTPD